ncbi:ecdysteroid 22-kinase family protein [Myxococcota bacterium]|nr:ecdysteroid 22-kinase family protein [Myxococcota bacterium]MBU1535238.1 ecdysteroid 22-kinase family protein [Myxococcota bacterium]
MNRYFLETILSSSQAKAVEEMESIQELWSGYGEILRVKLGGATSPSVVVKHVRFPRSKKAGSRSHERKLRSYGVETSWYENYSHRCGEGCRVPHALAIARQGEEVLIVMEDLDVVGFSRRRYSLSPDEMFLCLSWLAHFHATFMGCTPTALWKRGTYWHLATRPDELNALTDTRLKRVAGKIDARLSAAPFQTFVHGDAKLANFCFSPSGEAVAAVDFQYVGGGCGMKDVAYFIGSCLSEDEFEAWEADLLDSYFASLSAALERHQSSISGRAVEAQWRPLFPLAWTDFHRFYKGWSPQSRWPEECYSERIARAVIRELT